MGEFGMPHASEVAVKAGDTVAAGDIIGAVGNSGRSLGPHLHWELALGGVWIDPLEFIRYFPVDRMR